MQKTGMRNAIIYSFVIKMLLRESIINLTKYNYINTKMEKKNRTKK